MSKKESKYIVELTGRQLKLISDCVEDCCRFMAGQTCLDNIVSGHYNRMRIKDDLDKLHYSVTPYLPRGASYSWNGGDCRDDYQRKFIAETYPIYREILHFFADEDDLNNVYRSATLTCEEGGAPIKICRKE